MIKKIFCMLAVFFVAFSAVHAITANASYEAYYFDNYDVDVVVDEDYTFHITETLDTFFTEERHGIYRELPNYWGDTRLKYSDISVDGAPYIIENSTYSTSIRIGDANSTVEGKIIYKISYTVSLPKDSSSELDAVYINLIGHDHPTETYNSTMKITLPKKVDPTSISVISGYYFESGTEEKVAYEYTDRQVLTITLKEPLDTYEGITAKINLPEGYFQNVKSPFFLDEFLKWFLPLLLLLVGVIIWAVFGNDESIIVPVEVSLPDVSPIEAGYIIDGTVNDEDISSMIIYWASLGFIKIKQPKKGKYEFCRLKSPEGRPNYETLIFNNLFKEGEQNAYISADTIKTRLGQNIFSFKTGVTKNFNNKEVSLIEKKSKKMSRLNAFLAFLCFSLSTFFTGMYSNIGLGIFLAIISPIAFLPLYFWLLRILKNWSKRTAFKNGIRIVFYAILVLLYASIADIISRTWALNLRQTLLIISSSCLLAGLAYYTQKLSEYGHTLYERVLGFRHFIITAEKDWLEELANDTPEYFYKVLPYALVLGVSRVWIGKFAKAITAPPEWYDSEAGNRKFSSRSFAYNTVSDFTRLGINAKKSVYRTSSSSYSRPSSTYSYRPTRSYSSASSRSFSSSSRGFSGGGFSGGGSKSW
ncbi:MAG: DUF2207 domain-containing protein [Clostridia bacterium]|nr:DUF2207 domain-containing protein [Clostridia bacterium]